MAYGTFPHNPPPTDAPKPWTIWGLRMLLDLLVCALTAAILLICILPLLGYPVDALQALRVSFAFTCVVLPVTEGVVTVFRHYMPADPTMLDDEVGTTRRLEDVEMGH
ncbi:hypothetical protein FB45DRAFT_1010110 [Roridomyces roridus]|uniref:Uncharacterized protein n=1 Tax=Roridomyces roridus TaxID=1738132 RepID=A0AAD7B4T2_9AGAR|nr:hypothetical protein FB45DRAFT_1010110 [Roridomyces roridus]